MRARQLKRPARLVASDHDSGRAAGDDPVVTISYREGMNRLGELERAIMEVLWLAPDPMTVRQVGDCLTDRDLAHTTVMTVLDRLAKKGFVRRQRAGRAWRYRPAESREAYVAELMLTALDQTGDRQAALTRFAKSVSGSEAEALRAALEALSGGGGD